MEFRPIQACDDGQIARIIRENLEANGLDIPGTAYYDKELDHLSSYYNIPTRSYYVLLLNGEICGGVGVAPFPGFPECCELQKLYLMDDAKGGGLGYKMMKFIENRAKEKGFKRIYLETHTNLKAAIHIYEKTGYTRIEKPDCVVHSTMDRFYIKNLV